MSKYVFYDCKVQWNYPLRECFIKDYLNTYRVTEIFLYKHKAIGGLVDPAIIWKVIIYFIKKGEEWLIRKAFEAAFEKLLKDAIEKYIHRNKSNL